MENTGAGTGSRTGTAGKISEGDTRPGTRGSNDTAGESVGILTVASEYRGSDVIEEVAEDMSAAMFDGLLQESVTEQDDVEDAETQRQTVAALQVELANAHSEIERATLKEAEQEMRAEQARQSIEDLKQQVARERQAARDELASLKANTDRELQDTQRQLHEASQISMMSQSGDLEDECNVLRHKVSILEGELSNMQTREPSSMLTDHGSSRKDPTMELPAEGGEETQLLASAYQQISVLNTQLAHLYTELTMARTEAQQLRGQHGEDPQSLLSVSGVKDTAETQKQSQQIADLVSDIRHLQLDLEYHQQKLDQMIEEKQQMMKDMMSCQAELGQAKEMLGERDQRLKHQEVDLTRLRQIQNTDSSQDGAREGTGGQEMVSALRAEATAKDSALIVSHYELHKEKLMRDRLEQKNLQLMERMQKLMMVVETMRKDNLSLERSLATKERSFEEKEMQLNQVTQRTKQLVKHTKMTPRSRAIEASQGLPPLRSAPGSA